MTGTSITAAAANAAKQLQSFNSGNSTSTANLSQLQLLGLDPNAVQKYLKAKSDATGAAGADQSSPMQDGFCRPRSPWWKTRASPGRQR